MLRQHPLRLPAATRIVERCIFCSYARFFHSIPPAQKQYRQSPSVQRKEDAKYYALNRTDAQEEKRKVMFRLDKHLQLAYQQGFLPTTIEEAEAIIQRFSDLSDAKQRSPTTRDVAQVLEDNSIHVLTLIGRILIRSPKFEHGQLGKKMLLAASHAGDSDATVRLLWYAYRQDRRKDPLAQALLSSELAPVRKKLASYATTDGDPYAKLLLARMKMDAGDHEGALKLCEKAVASYSFENDVEVPTNVKKEGVDDYDILTDSVNFAPVQEGFDAMGLNAPWTLLGELLLMHRKDRKGAFEAFRKGALLGDDPIAYYFLASFQEYVPKYSADWLTYIGKAAASGHDNAAFELGKFYLLPELKAFEPKEYENDKLPTQLEASVVKHLRSLRRTQWKWNMRTTRTKPYMGMHDGCTGMGLEWWWVSACNNYLPSRLALGRLLWHLGYPEAAFDLVQPVVFYAKSEKGQAVYREMAKKLIDDWERINNSGDLPIRRFADQNFWGRISFFYLFFLKSEPPLLISKLEIMGYAREMNRVPSN